MPLDIASSSVVVRTGGTLLFVASLLGWGELTAAPLRWRGARSWGMTLVLGVGAVITIGGVLCWAGVISRLANGAVAAVGLVAFVVSGAGRIMRMRRGATPGPLTGARAQLDPLEVIVHAAAIAYLVVSAVGATRPFWFDACDDLPAYFEFPVRLLGTGTFLEPFSSRRMATLGGAAYLQSFLVPLWGPSAVPLVDVGLGQLVAWGAALSIRPARTGPASRALRLAGPIFVIVVGAALPIYNHAPMRLAFGLVLAFLIASAGLAAADARSGDLALVAATGAALISLRNSFLALALAVLCAWATLALLRRERRPAWAAAGCAAAMLALLVPWSLVSWRSSGTPFYPLLGGNFRAGAFSPPLPFTTKLAIAGDALSRMAAPWIAVAGAAAWLIGSRAQPAAVGVAAALATSALVALSLTGFDTYNVFRYASPMLDGALAFVGCSVAAVLCEGPKRRVALGSAVAAAVGLVVALGWPLHLAFYERDVEVWRPRDAIRSSAALGMSAAAAVREPLRMFASGGSEAYAAAQRAMPRGVSVASAVSRPFLWDLELQRIDPVDIPGVASPAPGMPYLAGADALSAYFRGLGYDFLAFTPPASPGCLYERRRWNALAHSALPMWNDLGKRVIDFLSTVELLARTRPVVFASEEVVVVDLR